MCLLLCVALLPFVIAQQLSSLISYSFSSSSEQILAGNSARTCTNTDANGFGENIPSSAIFGDVAILKGAHNDGNCYSQAAYSDTNIKVEQGTITDSGGRSFASYRISPPTTPASQFSAGGNEVFIRVSQAGGVDVYTFDGTGFTKVSTITVGANIFFNTGIKANDLSVATVVMVDATGARLSVWPIVAANVEGASLQSTTDFTLSALRFDVSASGQPFDPALDWGSAGDGAVGPGSWKSRYGLPKQFFSLTRNDGMEGVLWQDLTSKKVYMTWFANDFCSSSTIEAATSSNSDDLIAAASDGSDVIIFLLGTAPTDKYAGTTYTAYKVDCTTGAQSMSKVYDTSASGLNIHAFSESGASIVWNTADSQVFIIVARTMTRGSDNLNHQGAIAMIVDASTLNLVKNWGQTASHCFGNSALLASDGTYLGMDLGDNYPRGIMLSRFTGTTSKKTRLVYAFKTQHATTANGRDVYTEISDAQTTYYKWSNDNNVYTELAHRGLVEVDDGLLVFFAGEDPPLDNSQVGNTMNKPRNFGYVKWPKDLSSTSPLSSGDTVIGGFYSYGGGWTAQTNKGINFITSYTSMDSSVSRPKAAKIDANSIFLYFEIWTSSSYVSSKGLVVDKNGAVTQQTFDLSYPIRLPFTDDLTVSDGKVVAYAGTAGGYLVRYEMCSGSSCSSTSQSGATCGASSGGTTSSSTIATTTNAATTTSGEDVTSSTGSASTAGGETSTITTETNSITMTTLQATTTTAAAAPNMVFGTLKLQIDSFSSFMEDEVAKDGVKAGIATAADVSYDWVALTYAQVIRRLQSFDDLGESRRLTDEVQVSYDITIPSGAAVTASTVQSTLASKQVSELNNIVKEKVQLAKGDDYTIAVTEISAVQQGIASTSTAAVGVASSSTAEASTSTAGGSLDDVNLNSRDLPWLCACLIAIGLCFF